MSLLYLLDENQRGVIWQVIQRHNARGIDRIDAVRVGDIEDLPLGTDDESILRWAERNNRVLVTFDRKTMPACLAEHLAQGHSIPGVFMLSRECKSADVLEFLVLASYATEPAEWRDWIKYL